MSRRTGALGTILAGALGCSALVQPPSESPDPPTRAADAEPAVADGEREAQDAALDGSAIDGSAIEPPLDAGDGMDASAPPTAPDAEANEDASEDAPDAACEARVLQVMRSVPELMLVVDRSQSMAPAVPPGVSCAAPELLAASTNCSLGDQAACDSVAACQSVDCAQPPYQGSVVCGGSDPSPAIDRWEAAVQGVEGLTRQFQRQLTFGLTIFPGEAAGPRGAGDICAAASVRVPLAPNAAPAVARALRAIVPGGATPLASALTAALEHLQSRPPPVARYLLLLTDGQPTCPNSRGNTLNAQTLAQDHAAALQALDALAAAGVKTYVLGFVAPDDTSLAMALGEFASHGGTVRFYPVKDAQSIAEHFAEIAPSLTAPCSVLLEAERGARRLSVRLDAQELEADAADGWRLEGARLTLLGAACQKFSDGRAHALSVEASCHPQPR